MFLDEQTVDVPTQRTKPQVKLRIINTVCDSRRDQEPSATHKRRPDLHETEQKQEQLSRTNNKSTGKKYDYPQGRTTFEKKSISNLCQTN